MRSLVLLIASACALAACDDLLSINDHIVVEGGAGDDGSATGSDASAAGDSGADVVVVEAASFGG